MKQKTLNNALHNSVNLKERNSGSPSKSARHKTRRKSFSLSSRRKQIKIFWQRVKAKLKALKVSQREFAEHIHISRRTLEGWIYQLRFPGLEASFRISAALGISMEDLLWGKEETAFDRFLAEAEARKEATKAMDKLIYQLAMRNSRLHGGAKLKYTGIWGIPSFSKPAELRRTDVH